MTDEDVEDEDVDEDADKWMRISYFFVNNQAEGNLNHFATVSTDQDMLHQLGHRNCADKNEPL